MIITRLALSLLLVALLSVACGSSNEASQTDKAKNLSQAKQIKPAPDPLEAKLKKVQAQLKQTTATPSASAEITKSKSGLVQFAAYDIKGNLHNSDEWIGKQPTVVNLWGTWCPPCRREIPDLVKLNQEYSEKGVALLGLAVRDTPKKVEKFAAANKMDWLMMMGDRQHLASLGSITGVPTTIFFNREGKEVQRFVGPRSYEVFKRAFEAIL
jgi:thiol-disulfide isomerase/thioredoxin